jgi:AraC-like DNA-binding protein
LNNIADRFFISPYYLSRMFKTVTGMKLMEYVTLVRVFEAQNLLRHSQWKVRDIACKAGFPTTSHFNRVFKKVTELTPSQYRQVSHNWDYSGSKQSSDCKNE